jgi:hypothetical protein
MWKRQAEEAWTLDAMDYFSMSNHFVTILSFIILFSAVTFTVPVLSRLENTRTATLCPVTSFELPSALNR